MEGVQSFGHSWSAISAQIPGRPPLTCRNRWRVVSKKSQATVSTEGNAGRKATSITSSDHARFQSVSNNVTASQSTAFASGSPAAETSNRDFPNLDVDSHPFLSSCSAVVEEVVGTNGSLEDSSHTFSSLMEELYESQHTSAMLSHLSDNVSLPGGSPGPSVIPSQSSHESILPDGHVFDLDRDAERRAELEAETAERRQDSGSAQIVAGDSACSDRSNTQLDWYLEQPDSLEDSLTAFPLTILPGSTAPTSRSREIHHHHHHHYHHHHYHHYHHYHHSHHYPS